jgi:beta-galactosidase
MIREPMNSIRRPASTSLDGQWRFQLLPGPDALLVEDAWVDVVVPSLWTMNSPQDFPHYTNVVMPFNEVYPHVPEANPVGVYRRVFVRPDHGEDRVILHVGAAEGHLTVRVNEEMIGTSTDSHLHAEFDITDALIDGENVIELAVAKWSAESYLEDQDQWWQFGLSRTVSLVTIPQIRLSDVIVLADYDADTSRGSIRVDVRTTGLAHQGSVEHSIRLHLLGSVHELPLAPRMQSPSLPPAASQRSQRPPRRLPEDFMDLVSIQAAAAPVPAEFRAMPNGMLTGIAASLPAGTALLTLEDLDVAPWTAETPHLETLTVDLISPDGGVVDTAEYRVGFRRVEIVGRDLLVNGRRILIQGVNRHDFDPTTGRVMSRQRMRDELAQLKAFNVNAIRTAHYPNDPYLLDLCDEYGLYVVDEADVEGHAFASTIANDPRYLEPILERVKRMVLRDRNHPSVIGWSLGNETGYGAAHDAAAAWVRHVDPSRPVQYEGAIAVDWHGGRAATDVVCPMYPSFAALEAYARDPRADRPLITCEYAYSQGNSTGGLADYWNLFESLPGLQGGFIWEYMDHALDPDHDGRFRYGGDFGDVPNDGTTVLNGLVLPDLTPKPAFFEMRGIFGPIRIVSDAAAALVGRVRLRNRYTFADLNGFTIRARVESRTGITAESELEASIVAGGERTILLPDHLVEVLHRPDALALTITVSLREDEAWAAAGTVLSAQQVLLPRTPTLERSLPGTSRPAALTESGQIRHPLLAAAPKLQLWRALTDNDNSFALDQRFVRSGFFALTVKDLSVKTNGSSTHVVIKYTTAFGDSVVHQSRVTELGPNDYLMDEHVTLPEGSGDGLRVGVAFTLATGFENAAWTGLGPWENYPDRKSSALLGRWSSPIAALSTPYIKPQENGTRGGVDELTLTGPSGRACVTANVPLHATISRHSISDLEKAGHWWELPESTHTHVILDIAHRGVGTAMLGPDARPVHRLHGRTYRWQWRLAINAQD